MRVQSIGILCGKIEKDFRPNFIQPFVESIYKRSRNDGRRELILIFNNSH